MMTSAEFLGIINQAPYLDTINELPRRLVILWKWPGYQSSTGQVTEEFGRLELEPMPRPAGTLAFDQHLFVTSVTVDREFRNCGYGTELYMHACRVARRLGYIGIASDPLGRFSDASHVWRKLQSRRVGPYDVLEEPQAPAAWVQMVA